MLMPLCWAWMYWKRKIFKLFTQMRAMWAERDDWVRRSLRKARKKHQERQQKHNLWFLLIYLVYGKCFVLVNLSNSPLIHSSSSTSASNHNTRENNGLSAATTTIKLQSTKGMKKKTWKIPLYLTCINKIITSIGNIM
jgi:hypothetical protein